MTDSILILLRQGSDLFDRKDYLNAIACFTQAIERLKSSSEQAEGRGYPLWKIYCRRALAWSYREEYEIAIADLNEALRECPDDAAIYLARGQFSHARSDWQHAVSDFTHALELGTAAPVSCLYQRALTHLLSGNPHQAKKDCEEAFRQAGDASLTDYPELVQLRNKLNEIPGLCQPANSVLNKNRTQRAPASAGTKEAAEQELDLAASCHANRDDEKALEYVNAYLDRNPDSAQACQLRGEIFYYMKQLDAAREDCLHAFECDPKNQAACELLVRIYNRMYDFTSARLWRQKLEALQRTTGPVSNKTNVDPHSRKETPRETKK
ncbi:MAG: hypothetical protein Q4G68_08475 [Planctomycetia bacterium]|nr:hypothetical protein [Planctomycetia bacterium]